MSRGAGFGVAVAMSSVQVPNDLQSGLHALELDPALGPPLAEYLVLLSKWNRTYNLTAIDEPQEMVTRHLLDSLVALQWLRGERVLDVGSGAGLPGIPLALAAPQRAFTLLDANAKKTRFLRQAVLELGLQNVEVVQARVERYRPERPFDTVIARAFASVAEFLAGAGACCAVGGRLLAMKGRYPGEELDALPDGYRLVDVIPLSVPGLKAERHLVVLEPTG